MPGLTGFVGGDADDDAGRGPPESKLNPFGQNDLQFKNKLQPSLKRVNVKSYLARCRWAG
jgi:hypothetical protein